MLDLLSIFKTSYVFLMINLVISAPYQGDGFAFVSQSLVDKAPKLKKWS
jgi:hypothetical protein